MFCAKKVTKLPGLTVFRKANKHASAFLIYYAKGVLLECLYRLLLVEKIVMVE
jgi:hypothetical protein